MKELELLYELIAVHNIPEKLNTFCIFINLNNRLL